MLQANCLRPEPGYWFHLTPSEDLRHQRVLEALRFLPRPLILYVTQPLQAEAWMRTLRKEGYARLALSRAKPAAMHDSASYSNGPIMKLMWWSQPQPLV